MSSSLPASGAYFSGAIDGFSKKWARLTRVSVIPNAGVLSCKLMKRQEYTSVQSTMQRIKPRYMGLLFLWCACFSTQAFAQKFSFGVVSGINVRKDFRTTTCFGGPDNANSDPGCPRFSGWLSFGVSDDSSRFIIGPKLNVRLSPSFSLEVNALHRRIRTVDTFTGTICLPLGEPDCTTAPLTRTTTSTAFSWEFPFLATYQFSGTRMTPFIQGGPSFRPVENAEIFGFTAGGGVKLRLADLTFSPTIRYTRWDRRDRYVGLNEDQIQFVLGIDGPESAERVSAFGRNLSVAFMGGIGLTDGLRRGSTPPFNFDVIDPATGLPTPASGTRTDNLSRTSPVLGVAVEVAVRDRLSIEVDGLYRPLNSQDVMDVTSLGFTRTNKFTVLTWEFPILAKYRMPIRNTTTFFELGPALRASGNLNNSNPSRYGAAAGFGLEIRAGRMTISPTMRFTRWAADQSSASMATHRNQAELLFGFRF